MSVRTECLCRCEACMRGDHAFCVHVSVPCAAAFGRVETYKAVTVKNTAIGDLQLLTDALRPRCARCESVDIEMIPEKPIMGMPIYSYRCRACGVDTSIKTVPAAGATLPKARLGYTVIRVMPELEGKQWGPLARAYVSALRPSQIRLVYGAMKSDSKLWRVTVHVDSDRHDARILRLEQEVEVELPEGVANGYELSCKLEVP